MRLYKEISTPLSKLKIAKGITEGIRHANLMRIPAIRRSLPT